MAINIMLLRDPYDEALYFLRDVIGYPAEIRDAYPDDQEWNYQSDTPLVVITDIGGVGPSDIINDVAQISIEVSHKYVETASLEARQLHGVLQLWPHKGRKNVVSVTTNRRPAKYPLANRDDIETYMFILTIKFTAENTTILGA